MLGLWLKRLGAALLALGAVGIGLMVLVSLIGAISGRIIHARVDQELRAAGESMAWEEFVKQPGGFETEESKQLEEVARVLMECYKKLPKKIYSNRVDLRWNNPASLKPFPIRPLDQSKEPARPETWQDRDHLAAPLIAEINRLQDLNLSNRRLSQSDLTRGYEVNTERLNRRLEMFKVLSAVAEIHMGCGRWNEAAKTVCLGYRLLEPTQYNDIIIDQLVRATSEGVIQGRCFEMLPQVNDSQVLRELLKTLGELPDYLALADKSLTYERLLFLNSTGEQRQRIVLWAVSPGAFADQRMRARGFGERFSLYYMDGCWMDWLLGQTKKQHRLYQKAWREALDQQNVEVCRRLEQRLTEEGKNNSMDASRLFVGALVGYQKKLACADISRALTRTAVAIRLYQLERGRLPKNLDELVPAYLPEVPRDWGDGKNLRYRLESKDSYLLYSVGWDGEDQAGDPSDTEKRPINMGFRAERMRDIVWPRIDTAP